MTMYAAESHALDEAVAIADRNETPCYVLERDGWFVPQEDPDEAERLIEDEGWHEHALVEPTVWDVDA